MRNAIVGGLLGAALCALPALADRPGADWIDIERVATTPERCLAAIRKQGLASASPDGSTSVPAGAREAFDATLAAFDPDADPSAQTSAVVTTTLRYLRNHRAFVYIRDHEPHWLLDAGLPVGNDRLNLVRTVAAMVAQAIPDSDQLALTPVAAAEVVVRTVLSHTLIEDSALTDDEVAEVVSRAITRASGLADG